MADRWGSTAAGQDWPACGSCGERWSRLAEGQDGVARCGECVRRLEAAMRLSAVSARLLARLDELVLDFAARAGLSPRERRSSILEATREILEAIPRASGSGLMMGSPSCRGFGLSGPAGIGKSGALAAMLMEGARARLERDLPVLGADALKPWALWLSWPDTVNRLRVTAARDGGVIEVEEFIASTLEVDFLVLDDLGAERIRGSYVDDWAASQLDLLIDGRYRHDRRTWFTTTLSQEEVLVKYGQRVFSRLCGENDLVELPALADRRMDHGRA